MKKRIFAILLCVALFVSFMPISSVAEEATVVKILDGKITKSALYTAFGGSNVSGKSVDYRYCVANETGWKRVNQGDRTSTDLAENVFVGKTFTLQKAAYSGLAYITGSRSWLDVGTFVFVTYHNVEVKTDGAFPEGGFVTVDGETANKTFAVDEGKSLTLAFGEVEDYSVQIKIGSNAWKTLSENSYVYTPDRSTTVSVRYISNSELENKHSLTVNVVGSLLGEYSGIESDRVSDGSEIDLTLTPYNSSTGVGEDLWAYVKSVKVNGEDLSGTYSATVFNGSFTVSEDTTVEIEFAKRLVLKTPTVSAVKYSGDPATMMYGVNVLKNKAVSAQVDKIEKSIIENVVDSANSADCENATIYVKYVLVGATNFTTISANPLIFYKDAVGNKDEWEEIQLDIAASGERYPAVRTDDITCWIFEDPSIEIEGVTAEDAVYDGNEHKGYTGTPTNTYGYRGSYEITYVGRNSTVYSSDDAPVNAGDYTVTISTESGNTDYVGSVSLDFTISGAPLVLKPDAGQSKIYGEEDPDFTWAVVGGTVIDGDELENISATRTDGENVGEYGIILSQTDGSNPNYIIEFAGETFEITPKTLEVVWGDVEFTYDGTEKVPTATAVGTVFGDEITLMVSGGATEVGDYVATVSAILGDKADNYFFGEEISTAFSIKEAPEVPETPKPVLPGTSDHVGFTAWFTVLVTSAFGLLVITLKKRV